jgi:sortase (surface protein transpeptidase)
MPTVYEIKSGKPLKCEAVDVKELVASKFYTDKNPNDESEKDKSDTGGSIKVPEIKAKLDELKVEYSDKAKKPELLELLEKATAE